MFKFQEKNDVLKRIWIPVLVLFVVFGVAIGGMVSYASTFENRVFPGVHVADIAIGGMDRDELRAFLYNMNDKLINEGFHFSIAHEQGVHDLVIYPLTAAESGSAEIMTIDIDSNIDDLMNYGKQSHVFRSAIAALMSRVDQPNFSVGHITINEQALLETLLLSLEKYETQPVEAQIAVESLDPLSYTISTSSAGIVYNTQDVASTLLSSWQSLAVPEITLEPIVLDPSIAKSDIERLTSTLAVLSEKPVLRIVHEDPKTQFERVWTIREDIMLPWITAKQVSGTIVLGFDEQAVTDYLNARVAPDIDEAAQNARFEIASQGAVKAFQSSRPGVTLDREQTAQRVETAAFTQDLALYDFVSTTPSYTLVEAQVAIEEPSVTLGEANDLGITEILGVGYSNFAGSPANRVKNIRNAIRKLNGLLIAPGEEFSTIAQTKPFSVEGGYVPELVIKGDRVIPEMGGGLCQIGSTLFRMAMNSGMDITQRRNHSLVVSYYNDHRNGLPGTDATLYDPAPDFRFVNDTGNYVLIEAEADYTSQELFFTLWGTSDGRKASYSLPVVHRWIPHGDTKYIKTTEIPAGTQECQHAYRGADVSFTYTRVMADGEVQDTVYDSYYRPLAQICLVGVTEQELACEESGNCTAGDDTVQSDAADQTGEETVADPTADVDSTGDDTFTPEDQKRIEESVIFPGDAVQTVE